MTELTLQELETHQIQVRALKVWNLMNDNEKFGVRVGLFPAKLMEKYDTFPGPKFAVALMKIATENGGMRA